jgi:hypothetical protein
MSTYTFKRNKTKGCYEVYNGNVVEKECHTMGEAQEYISRKANNKRAFEEEAQKKTKKPSTGFGHWGTPDYILKPASGKYDSKGKPTL